MRDANTFWSLSSGPWNGTSWVSGPGIKGTITPQEHRRLHYKPWYMDLSTGRKDWWNERYPGFSGEYFGHYPSMPQWEHEGYKVDGQIFAREVFTCVQQFGETGHAFCCFVKSEGTS